MCSDLEGNASIPRPSAKASFPHLHSLSVHESDAFANAFLKYRGPDLYQLDLKAWPSFPVDEIKKIKFSRLQRLHIHHGVPSEIAEHIVKTASNLNSACYTTYHISRASVHDEMSQFIHSLLTTKGNLSDLSVCMYRLEQLDFVSKTIECALQTTRKRKRKLLRIGLQCFAIHKVDEAAVLISRMLNRLSLCKIDEYALFTMLYAGNRKKENEMMQEVKDLVADLENVELVRSEASVFIIRSKGSRINSYKMWWNEGGQHESKWPTIY